MQGLDLMTPPSSPISSAEARNHVEMAGLSHAVSVQLGHSDDAVQMATRLDRRSLDQQLGDPMMSWLMPWKTDKHPKKWMITGAP